MFEVEYEFGEEDLIHFNELQFMRNDEIQHNIKKNRWIVPGVMGLIGGFYYFYYGDMTSSGYILVIAAFPPFKLLLFTASPFLCLHAYR